MQALFDPAFDSCMPWPWASEDSVEGLPKASIGQMFVGEEGLLSLLEGLLGFAPANSKRLDRCLAYLQALEEANSADRFYRKSLAVDAMGTANSLLAWRDQWMSLGWSPRDKIDLPRRLRDMIAVEKACSKLPLGQGDRIRRILKELSGTRLKLRVFTLRPSAQYQGLWGELFAVLKSEVHTRSLAPQAKNTKSSLYRLQNHLAGHATPNKLPLDDSLQFIEAPSETLLGFYTAHLIAPWFSRTSTGRRSLIVSWDRSDSFNLAMMRQGLPRAFDGAVWGQGEQVFPLILQLPWKPFDPHLVLHFLEHSANPLPFRLRRELAFALSAQPGYNGPSWKKAVEDYSSHEARQGQSNRDVHREIERWLKPDQWDSSVPLATVQSLCLEVIDWVRTDPSLSEVLANSILESCKAFQSVLNVRSGLSHHPITRLELNKLLADSRTEPTQRQLAAQCSQVITLSRPEALLGPAERILVWAFHDKHRVEKEKWSAQEILALEQQGVRWPDPRQSIRDDRRLALQTMMMAREELIVAVPQQIEGEHCRQHPLMISLRKKFPGLYPLAVEDVLREKEGADRRTDAVEALELQPLAKPRRYIRIEKGILGPRATESPSSIETLIYKPHNYVLRYWAKLREPRWRQAMQMSNLEGLVAHGLIEHFFKTVWVDGLEREQWQGKSPEQWIEDESLRIIGERAAPLNQLSYQSQRDYLIRTLKEAVPLIVEEARLSKVSQVSMEESVSAIPWSRGLFKLNQENLLVGLKGYIDLQWVNGQGQRCIIDIKWTRKKRKFHEVLRKNQQIQLAIYCAIQHHKHGKWAPSAYFVMPNPQLIAQSSDSSAFSSALPQSVRKGGSTEELWQEIQTVWQWRWEALTDGLIEVSSEEAAANESRQSAPTDVASINLNEEQVEYTYKTLLGWAS